jgi:uncharacterized protein HemX
MKPRNTAETAIICSAVVATILLLTLPFEMATAQTGQHNYSAPLVLIGLVVVIGLVLGGVYRYRGARQKDRLELTNGDKYRQLAEEYRRLADLAITAQEHTDLKLGDVSVQLDFLRQQQESLQRILKEVE